MKSKLRFLPLLILVFMLSLPSLAESTLSGNAQLIYETVRWNLNLPKKTKVVQAQELIGTFKPNTPVHVLLMELDITPEMQMLWVRASTLILVDLDSGYMIDYTNYDYNAAVVDGIVTDKKVVLNLIFGWYWLYLDGSNSSIVDEEDDIVIPVSEADIAAINDALTAAFVR